MAITDRLFSSDMAIIALYSDSTLPSSPPALLSNLISIFKNCSLRGETLKDPGRAISEGVERSLPYAKKYSIEVGTVVDPTFPSLFRIYIDVGPGPYWIWLQFNSADSAHTDYSFVTKVLMDTVTITSGGEADAENITLEAIQEFQPYGATNKIG